MDSTGVSGKIQVPEDTFLILKERGFAFEYRGEIYVKGISEQEGKIRTHFLSGRVQPNPLIMQPRKITGQYSLAAVVSDWQKQKQILNENNNSGIMKGHHHYNRRTFREAGITRSQLIRLSCPEEHITGFQFPQRRVLRGREAPQAETVPEVELNFSEFSFLA
ncbi:hypothetical protein F7725_010980 [Dissostichus mawsoni]|uniref:adenylate cyclase n=1 Tax=Dissostichus mawsoni TaxID=36200 RepID=A0A7J5Z9Q0_DISMA|nr:hypothetical protein F7725_010980 [Dissostichus mawsoni]